MKKKFFLLVTLLTMGLSSCVMYNGQGKPGAKSSAEPAPVSESQAPTSVTPPDPHGAGEGGEVVPVGTNVKIYLVFGPNGQYKGNPVTTSIASLFLENAMEIEGKAGDDLPTEADVTSSVEESKFVAWVAYNNDGKLTEYAKIPSVDGKILYASFSGGNGGGNGNSGGGQSNPPATYDPSTSGALPTSGYGFKFSDNTYMAASFTDDFDGYKQYLLTNRAFKKDQVFTLYDFGYSAAWTVSIDPYSFGGTSAHSTNWQEYIDHSDNQYKVLKDFNAEAVYIKLKENADQLYFSLGQ